MTNILNNIADTMRSIAKHAGDATSAAARGAKRYRRYADKQHGEDQERSVLADDPTREVIEPPTGSAINRLKITRLEDIIHGYDEKAVSELKTQKAAFMRLLAISLSHDPYETLNAVVRSVIGEPDPITCLDWTFKELERLMGSETLTTCLSHRQGAAARMAVASQLGSVAADAQTDIPAMQHGSIG